MTPTQRTIRELKGLGRRCAVVEKWNAYAGPHGIRQDLFGIIDVLALDPVRGFVGVQCCGQDFAAHWRKMTEEHAQECLDWLSTPGGCLELWSWRKVVAKRGGVQKVWRPRVREITIEDLNLGEGDDRRTVTTIPQRGTRSRPTARITRRKRRHEEH